MSTQRRKILHREIFPMIAIGLMMSVPAFAADQADQGRSTGKAPSEAHAAKATTKVDARHASAKASTSKATATKTAQSKAHHETKSAPSAGHAMGYDSEGRVIRRVALAQNEGKPQGFDHTLLDDGTFWREDGSQTTWQQTGMASWYGGAHWQGKRTSSGERYDQNQLTAAHATLPIGTKVRVARTDGRGSVVVTINDRPGSRTRVIDLSRAAAKELGILTAGVTMVTLQPL